MITDALSRRFKTLRVSVTESCNMACSYCVTGDHPGNRPRADYRKLAEMIFVLHARLGFTTLHFTGGEPLIYGDLVKLIATVHQSAPEIALKITTNGWGLSAKAYELAAAGITEVNVSMDAVEEAAFFRMTGVRGPERVVRGMTAASQAGLRVKVNSVIMRGRNEGQVVPLFRFLEQRDIPLRYLELMKMGHLHTDYQDHFVGMQELLAMLREAGVSYTALGRAPSGTACYWVTPGGYHFGIIANETVPFCHDCDRLRLDSQGNLYGCLSVNHPLPLADGIKDPQKLTEMLREALFQKQTVFTGSDLSMRTIGG